jgi:5-methylcytosine-specific restriction endonuclease McrBC regulatory subunit McrC
MNCNDNANLKTAGFWLLVPCSLVWQKFIDVLEVFAASTAKVMSQHSPDDGDSKHPSNVSELLPDYKAQQSRNQSITCTLASVRT